jgi:FKBP-type peptidyl-prolyl cis-trans isomerase
MPACRMCVAAGIGLALLVLSACGENRAEPVPAPSIPPPADVAAPPPGSLKTTSGLSTLVLQPGSGSRHPRETDRVRVHYTGWTTDGKMFDSSVARGQPTEFAVNEVIAGWTEGLQMMVEGEKRRFWIPEALAYKGQPGQPPGMLVFDVELIKIQ